MNARFDGPVHQVAGRDVCNHNQFVRAAVPGPDDHLMQATRTCPQCAHLTWAYNRHCHHCGLDMRAYSVRRFLHSTRYIAGAVLALSAVLWTKKSNAAPAGEIEIVRIDPKAKRVQPAGKLKDRAAAEAFVSDIAAIKFDLLMALRDPQRALSMKRLSAGLEGRSKALFSWNAMGQPFGRCHGAAVAADVVVERALAMVKTPSPTPEQVAALVNWSATMSDDLRLCSIDVDAAK